MQRDKGTERGKRSATRQVDLFQTRRKLVELRERQRETEIRGKENTERLIAERQRHRER